MANREASPRTFTFKNCCVCEGCQIKLKKLQGENPKLHSFTIDEEGDALTVKGTIDPAQVRKVIHGKNGEVKLLSQETPPVQPQTSVRALAKPYQGPDNSTPNHKHQFRLIQGDLKRFSCNGCKMDGFNSRYRCEICSYELHEICKNPMPEIHPNFLQGLTFEFCEKIDVNVNRNCTVCGDNILGYFYSCRENSDLFLHPNCSKIPREETIGDTVFVLRREPSTTCMWCDRNEGSRARAGEWCYVSSCKKYRLHVNCIIQLMHEAWRKDVKNITDSTSSSMAIETVPDSAIEASLQKKGGKDSVKFWKPLGLFLRAIIGIIFGDVTGILPAVLTIIDLLSK